VSVKVDFGDKQIISGKGASTDIIEASARAYLNALNRYLNAPKNRRLINGE
jgi:2-isopropylmalate synthase